MSVSGPPANTTTPPTVLYFGYESNLWQHQMAMRCPNSPYVGIARLNNFKWIINARGYANVVQVDGATNSRDEQAQVWGLVYILSSPDEVRLDINEGVPYAYTKEIMDIEFWPTDPDNTQGKIDTNVTPERLSMLVYIDRIRTKDALPKKEYIYRMNKGIIDALRVGVPVDYVDKVMRRFIPEMKKVDEGVEGQAKKQALEFKDEDDCRTG